MRIIGTFILINLMTTGIPETMYVSETVTNDQLTSFSLVNIVEVSSEEYLKSPQQLKNKFPLNDQLISIKILNESGEVIEKWLGRSKKVVNNSMSFLEKASSGLYKINGILIDGSESSFLFKKI